jgi:starch-binding outer membrane protein, SusD/RagB family
MKKINNISLILLGVAATFASCGTDYLDVDPYGKSDATTYYQNDNEITMGLNAAYDMLQSDMIFGWSSTQFIKQLPGDDTNCGGGGSSDQPQYQKLDDFEWTPENDAIKAFYQINYFGVYRCNQLINNAKSESALAKRMIAEAKFLRAYYYFDLTVAYGDVPLRLEAAATINEGMARTPQAQVYTQIEKDLTEAIAGLPNRDQYTGGDRFRASKQAAQALLGKVYVYQKKYNEAVTVLNEVILKEGTLVGLEADFSSISKKETEFGKESIFEASFVSDSKNWGNATWDRNNNDNRHLQLQGPRGPFVSGTSGIKEGWGFNAPTAKLYNAFPSNDPRRLHTVISNAELQSLYGGNFTDGWDTEGMIRAKYVTFASETSDENGASPELNYTTNWRLIRYADVLLLAAEAYHFSTPANNAKAVELMNKVRLRGGAPLLLTTLTGTAVFDAIVKERQLELAYEGSRFWDLVRWGLAAQELTSIGFKANKNERFPIPLDEINSNSMISAADQNPGY